MLPPALSWAAAPSAPSLICRALKASRRGGRRACPVVRAAAPAGGPGGSSGTPAAVPTVVTDAAVPEGHAGLHGFLYGERGAEEAHGSDRGYTFREVGAAPPSSPACSVASAVCSCIAPHTLKTLHRIQLIGCTAANCCSSPIFLASSQQLADTDPSGRASARRRRPAWPERLSLTTQPGPVLPRRARTTAARCCLWQTTWLPGRGRGRWGCMLSTTPGATCSTSVTRAT